MSTFSAQIAPAQPIHFKVFRMGKNSKLSLQSVRCLIQPTNNLQLSNFHAHFFRMQIRLKMINNSTNLRTTDWQ